MNHAVAEARDGGLEIGQRLARSIERRRVRDLQDARGEARLQAPTMVDHLIGGGAGIGERRADADDHVRKAGQIDRALGDFGGQLLQERERGRALFG